MWPFRAKETKWVRAALDARANRSSKLSSFPEIVSGARKLIDKPEWSVKYIRDRNLSPETFVAFLLNELIGRVLTTGTFHIYRGILNEPGKWLHEYYEELIDELVASGFYDEDDGYYWKGWLDEELEKVG